MKTYIIDGSQCGRIGCDDPASGWHPADLYGDHAGLYDAALAALVVEGRSRALFIASELCHKHSPMHLETGEEYLIQYTVRRLPDRKLMRVYRRIEKGITA